MYYSDTNIIDDFKKQEPYIKKSDKGGNNFYFLFSIFEYDEIPIVFVTTDDKNNIYLCNCVEFRNIQKIIIAKTTFSILKDVSSQQISLYNALKEYDKNIIFAVREYENDYFEQNKISIDQLSDNDLPAKTAKIKFPEDGVLQNIEKLKANYILSLYESFADISENNCVPIYDSIDKQDVIVEKIELNQYILVDNFFEEYFNWPDESIVFSYNKICIDTLNHIYVFDFDARNHFDVKYKTHIDSQENNDETYYLDEYNHAA